MQNQLIRQFEVIARKAAFLERSSRLDIPAVHLVRRSLEYGYTRMSGDFSRLLDSVLSYPVDTDLFNVVGEARGALEALSANLALLADLAVIECIHVPPA